MVELGEHCHTHIIPRLKKVIDGEDPGGITKAADWQGGGGFRYYRLAPSLLEKDRWGNWVINRAYNAAMLAGALYKLEGPAAFVIDLDDGVVLDVGVAPLFGHAQGGARCCDLGIIVAGRRILTM